MNKKEFITVRTRIISEMLDNPNDIGIYPTAKCFEQLDELFDKIVSERQTDHESTDKGEPCNEILADVISRLSLIEIENAVQLLHYEDDEYGNTKARCEELLEQTRNKIGYTKADFLACL